VLPATVVLRIGLSNVLKWVKLRVFVLTFPDINVLKLDGSRFILENAYQNQLCTMMNDDYKRFEAFKCQGRDPGWYYEGKGRSAADFLTH
jgi:hypothetical protein